MNENSKMTRWLRGAGLALVLALLAVAAFAAPRGTRAAGDNVVANGDFESGTKGWKCKICTVTTGDPSQSGAAAQMTTTRKTGRALLMQDSITLQPNTTYELKFWAQSNNGSDLQVIVQQHSKPFKNYGLKTKKLDVKTGWQEFTVTFTTKGFSQQVSNARLRFQADKGNGLVYSIDNVTLTAAGGGGGGSTPTPTPPPDTTPTPTQTPKPGGNGTDDEILVFNRGSKNSPFSITKSLSGFIEDKPPTGAANANWVTGQYAGFSKGTMYYRARIISIPQNQPNMKFGFCFWENKFTNEECRGQNLDGVPGTDITWSHKLDDMWEKSPINWANPRTKHGFLVRNAKNKPVSAKKGWNWNGENPDHWYPMEVHFTAVLVKEGGTFDGWENYGW